MATKPCFKCKETKEVSLFFKHNQTSDGYHSWCKSCCTEGNIKSRAKVYSTIEGRAKIFLQSCKRSAAKRNQEFSLTIEDIVSFWNKQNKTCAYSGVEMTLDAGKLNTVSIERINSEVGYTKENTVLVCYIVNRMKSDFKYEDFYSYCSQIAQFLGNEDLKLAVGGYK